MKFCMVGDLHKVVLGFKLYQNRSTDFGAVGVRNLPFPIDLAIGLYNSLYHGTSRDPGDSPLLRIGLCLYRYRLKI